MRYTPIHRRVPHRYIQYPTGVYIKGIYLIGACILEVASQRCISHRRAHLTGCAHLIGVYLIGVSLSRVYILKACIL
jgi:hypothetical protein